MTLTDPTTELAFEGEIAEHLAANGWLRSENSDGYDRKRAVFPEDIFAWLEETQPTELAKVIKKGAPSEQKDRDRLLDQIVAVLDTPIQSGGGTLNVLRNGVKHINATLAMCQFKPATGLNPKTSADYAAVRVRVMQQVVYSAKPGNENRIDLVLFVNGLPVATIELKTWFKQNAVAAVDQYRKDRPPAGEPLLGFGTRALVHFALDDDNIWMTTKLAGQETSFLPFNKGTPDGGKGNPHNESGHATSYLWEDVLQRDTWLNILGSLMFLQTDEHEDPVTGAISRSTKLMFPRFHQWDAVREITDAVKAEGTGRRYLVQHSAGSGKTNTIGWLAHQLSRLHNPDNTKMFEKVVIVSDRRVIDKQLQDAIRQIESDNKNSLIATIDAKAARAFDGSKRNALVNALKGEALIVVVTIQSFPVAARIITEDMPNGRFAVIADEAHSSQSGRAAVSLRKTLAAGGVEVAVGEDISAEDVLSALISEATRLRAESPNISYFAFTATPKNKTLSLFGRKDPIDPDALPRPFHLYSMKQAIEEGFILDVLRGYQSYKTTFKIALAAENGANATIDGSDIHKVNSKAAARKIIRHVKRHPTNIGQKVGIILEHFHANVAGLLDGHAKAMVVTDSRVAAVKYKRAIDSQIEKRRYGYSTVVAFSGTVDSPEDEIDSETEHSMNPGLGSDLAREFRKPEYRVMIVADKFQTGFDQPMLCAMYVDKKLEDVYAVQTLSRLNRTHTTVLGTVKDQTFVLDFVNDPDDILAAFQPYYLEAHVESETDPNVVHSLSAKLLQSGLYDISEVVNFATAWFTGKGHATLSAAIKPARDRFAHAYAAATTSGDHERIDELHLFRKDAATFVRLYDFMSQVINYDDTGLEKLSVFMRQLVRVIEVDRLDADIDITAVSLTGVRQIDKGEKSLTLTGEGDLGGGLRPGGRIVRPEGKKLSEVVRRINDAFGGELADAVIEGTVKPLIEKALEAKGIKDQIDNNALDQFLNSRDMRDALVDAVLALESDMDKIVDAVTGDGELTEEVIRALGTYMWQLRHGDTSVS